MTDVTNQRRLNKIRRRTPAESFGECAAVALVAARPCSIGQFAAVALVVTRHSAFLADAFEALERSIAVGSCVREDLRVGVQSRFEHLPAFRLGNRITAYQVFLAL